MSFLEYASVPFCVFECHVQDCYDIIADTVSIAMTMCFSNAGDLVHKPTTLHLYLCANTSLARQCEVHCKYVALTAWSYDSLNVTSLQTHCNGFQSPILTSSLPDCFLHHLLWDERRMVLMVPIREDTTDAQGRCLE